MANLVSTTLTSNSDLIVDLNNIRGNIDIYTTFATGDFGGGTVSFFINPLGRANAEAGTTNDVAIKFNQDGNDVSFTENGAFNFQCTSSNNIIPTVLKIKLSGATNPSLNIVVNNQA